jgi:hypothetical protein
MRSAISLGGQVVPVEVERIPAGFEATCTYKIGPTTSRFAGTAATYEGALAALRKTILDEPTPS